MSDKIALSTWPTPLERVPRLSAELGLGEDDLWIKRDDLIGLGGGGNKVRKLEWTVGAALAAGADTLVTTGAAQSNHARLTAAAGARLGLDVVLVFPGTRDSAVNGSGNLVLDSLFGARVFWAGDSDPSTMAGVMDDVCRQLRHDGARPFPIPFGGSSPLGARGYVDGGEELLTQLPDVEHVVVALGSGGTMAGLIGALGERRVLGVHCGAVAEPAVTVADLAGALTGRDIAPESLRIRTDQVGPGYGVLHEPVLEAMRTAALTEGVVLDPVYSGRAMAGLIAAVRDGDIRPGQRTALLHTGGLPGLFGHAETVHRAVDGLYAYEPERTSPRTEA
ncbi:D-cysteine desulfhydrase family protein [Streptomyces sp. NBC_01571]|uniref:D-cysteine desulfhydrase family protein n=1 Tax=unclassified Streptomyces TaxID=2593676 RepID=UPI00225C2D96|nr:D-cysteine desulfhydrase family protein [Streptomyces sp. NBC_01571]MCX4572991.1 D-cysteine desulfhydrase family protein [Streptomyces sp. NBC_01571]